MGRIIQRLFYWVLSLMAGTSVSAYAEQTGDGSTICGIVTSYMTSRAPYMGIYSFHAKKETATLSGVLANKLAARQFNGAVNGVYQNGEYVYYNVIKEIDYNSMRTNITAINYLIYDAKTWVIKDRIPLEPVFSNVPTSAMVFDKQAGVMYVVTYDDRANGFLLCTANLETGQLKRIAPIGQLSGLSVDSEGQMLGLNAVGMLFKVDRATGELTKVGDPGIENLNILSSVYDDRTGKLYASSALEEGTGLIETDTRTGKATLVCKFSKNERITGLFIRDTTHPGAPAPVGKLQLTSGVTPLDASLSFTAPSLTFGGNPPGSESLKLTVRVDAQEPLQTSIMPGEAYSRSIRFGQGAHTVYVQTENDAGVSPVDSVGYYAGEEVPAAPGDLKLDISETGTATLSWSAPETGLHGKAFDVSSLAYKIVRLPGERVVAEGLTTTAYSEQIPAGEFGNYAYKVIACAGVWEGGYSVSACKLYGGSYPVPFAENFDSSVTESVQSFVIEDTDGDGNTWKSGSGEMRCMGTDDWLFTPKIRLGTGHAYKLTFQMRGFSDQSSVSMKVALGNQAQSGAMNTVLLDLNEVILPRNKEFSILLKAPVAGDYRVGFYVYEGLSAYLDDVSVVESSSMQAPAGVTDCTASAAAGGGLRTMLSFKAPVRRIDGEALSSVDKIEIRRVADGNVIGVFENLRPGQPLNVTDETAAEGFNTYSIVASNEQGAGEEIFQTVYAGRDLPVAVGNLKIVTKGYASVLTWDAPAEGMNGGFVDPEELTYIIYRSLDPMDKSPQVAGGVKGNTYTDENVVPDLVQKLAFYQVAAFSDRAGVGAKAREWANVGHPWAMPFRDNLEEGRFQRFYWYEQVLGGDEDNNAWIRPTLDDYKAGNTPVRPMEGDSCYVAYFNFTKETSHGRLNSPKFSMKESVNPYLSFRMFHSTRVATGAFRIEVSLRIDDGTAVRLSSLDVNDGTDGWKEHRIALKDYNTETDHSTFVIDAYSKDDSEIIALDNFLVEDYLPYEMLVSAFDVPTQLTAGTSGKAVVTIKNGGRVAVSGYSVELYRDDRLQSAQAGTPLEAGEIQAFEFALTSSLSDEGDSFGYVAKVIYAEDMNPANNTSRTMTLEITVPVYPAVSDLTAVQEGEDVVLRWTKPALNAMKPTVEAFSGYEPFTLSLDTFGVWKTYDIDKQVVYSIGDDQTYYPHINEPNAYQIWNAGLLGYQETGVQPHSAEQCLVGWASTGWSGKPEEEVGTPVNDDWLVSPRIVGGTQLSFWVAQPDAESVRGKNEAFEVHYSVSDDQVSSFRLLKSEVMQVKETWVEYTFTLPLDAAYFAIRHTVGAFMLLLDDIRYVPYMELTLVGYQVYRDGEQITESPVGGTTFRDPAPSVGKHEYAVSCVYDLGKSSLSNRVELVRTSGIGTAETGLVVYAAGGMIHLEQTGGVQIGIYTVTGVCVFEESGKDRIAVPLRPGVYLVKAGGETYKCLIN